MYLVASGGNPGLSPGTNNTSLALMAALGSCGNLNSSTHIVIDEVTTVAAVYALAPFMATNSGAPGASLGTSVGNTQGLTNAFATAQNLVDIGSGAAPGPTLPAGATAPTAELNTLADIQTAAPESAVLSSPTLLRVAEPPPPIPLTRYWTSPRTRLLT